MAKRKAKPAEQQIIEVLEAKDDGEISDKEFIQMMIDIMTKVPKEIYLSALLTYAWSKTHTGGINSGDLMLGALGGFTLAPALEGGIAANAWAMSYLGSLGWNFVDQGYDALEWLKIYLTVGTLGTVEVFDVAAEKEARRPPVEDAKDIIK